VREYSKRLEELRRFARDKGFPLIEGEYDARRWTSGVKHLRFLGERSERCRQCCRIRLERAFMVARDRGFGAVATTLSISPHKSAEMINAIGTELEKEYGVRFLESDFKKNGGYGKSVELSKAYGFYRQNYCGCIYSKVERDKTSSWNKIPRKII
jgi:predicted adenine nucleotide alpha hydrolase (AANH) superfamily ATPase